MSLATFRVMPSLFYPGPTFRGHWPIGAGRAGSNIGSGPEVTWPAVLGFKKSYFLKLCTVSGKHAHLMSRLPSSPGHVVTWLHVDLEQATLYLQSNCSYFHCVNCLYWLGNLLVCERVEATHFNYYPNIEHIPWGHLWMLVTAIGGRNFTNADFHFVDCLVIYSYWCW